MLTVKENLNEVLKKNGKPDRFVKQFEFLNIVPSIYYLKDCPTKPGTEGYDQFGVLWRLPEGQLGAFPVHDDEHRVLKDITEWRDIIKKPVAPEEPGYWGFLNSFKDRVDKENQYFAGLYAQGIFERLHALMGMEDCLANFYLEPDEMHALIDFLTDVEIEIAETNYSKLNIEAVFHHDDWGSDKSSFMSPQMFDEFMTPAYKKIYKFYHDHGILVVHHNDGYSANLVPSMIEMGIDIWQGVLPSNDIPTLIKEYGGDITFMGGIESRLCDVPDWSPEVIAKAVEKVCEECGPHNFIPCLTAGKNGSFFLGVHEEVNKQIDLMSVKLLQS